jgi:dihydroflavonol-4-reductase
LTAVVTGASGHVGANLVRELLARGDHVRALVHVDTAALSGLDVQLVQGDIFEVATLRSAFKGADVVYHLAGHIDISGNRASRLADVNIGGTRNVVQACLDCRTRRLVHFSSIHAMVDSPAGAEADESTPLVSPSPRLTYDSSKAEGERIVREAVASGLDAVILSPTAIVGPHDYKPSHFGRVLLRLATGRLPVVVGGGFDWVDARDVVAAAVAAAVRATPGSKYVLSGHWVSISRVAELICGVTGARRPVGAAPLSLARACAPLGEAVCYLTGAEPVFTRYAVAALAQHRHVSHERATRELGYRPRPFEQTLVDTCRWFEERGILSVPARGAM